ncbi:MAG: hypothetical protein V1738_01770 [Patescibacteria group bacterium]
MAKNYVECVYGTWGEKRLLRLVCDDMTIDALHQHAAKIVRQISDDDVMNGLPGVMDGRQTKQVAGMIHIACLALDMFMTGLGLMPRNLSPDLFHVLTAREFNRHIGKSFSGSVRRGHTYLRRPKNTAELMTSFMRTLCHETMHLSAATVVEIEPVAGQIISLRTGLLKKVGGLAMFGGLNESVTDRASKLLYSIVCAMLGITDSPEEMVDLAPTTSSYEPHEAIVDLVCRRVYPESNGAEGWNELFYDLWCGTNRWLEQVMVIWPAAAVVLCALDATAKSAVDARLTLGLD